MSVPLVVGFRVFLLGLVSYPWLREPECQVKADRTLSRRISTSQLQILYFCHVFALKNSHLVRRSLVSMPFMTLQYFLSRVAVISRPSFPGLIASPMPGDLERSGGGGSEKN